MSLLRRIWWRAAIVTVFAIVAWQSACWWTGPVVAYSLPLSRTVALQLLGFTQRGELIAAGVDPQDTRSARVCLWSVPSLKPTVVWRSPVSEFGTAWQFSLSSNGRWLNIDLAQSRLVLDLETRKEFPHTKEGTVWVSPDGRLLMNDDSQPGIEVSELQTGRVLGRIEDPRIHEISPNGQWVLTNTGDGYRVWRIHEDKVTPTELMFDVLVPQLAILPVGPDKNSAGLTHHKTLWGHFTPDSRRLCVRAIGTFGIWELDPPELLQTQLAFSVPGISIDGLWTFLDDGRRLSTTDGNVSTLFRTATDRGLQLGPLLDGNRRFLAVHTPTSNLPSSKGLSIPIGNYLLSLSPRTPESRASYCLYDAVTGEAINLPHWIARPDSPETMRVQEKRNPRAFLHPSVLALLSPDMTVCWMTPLPPARPWLKQLAIWLSLTALMSWLLLRRSRPNSDANIFPPRPTDRVAPAPASASH